ncbi:major capsid protein [Azospirillum doebereinerae]|uniref:major capsid protein n=1 Tax=Azospirillum doebereinerae TaxID=92933 RepID=UPI001EE5F3EA|nr:major capsid protein [Azospirillum doebereinerae]MCG5243967.1 major capsid protein [Azospirillum doebereinerae]
MGVAIINLFKRDMFSAITLTDEINDRDELPDQISSLVTFEEKSLITTTASVVKKGHSLSLVPFTPRGAPGKEYVDDKREAVQFESRQIRQDFTITADEIQDVLLFGSMAERLESLQDKVRERMDDLLDDERTTMEYHKLGTLMGEIREADGVTVAEDLFQKFGVERPADINFDLPAKTPGALRGKCTEVIREMRAGAQAKVDTVHSLCGKDFMDDLYRHPDVIEGYKFSRENDRLRDRAAFVPLDFGGIQFEEYTGYATGEDGDGPTPVDFIDPDNAHFFPLAVSGSNTGNGINPVNRLFQLRWAPAPFFSRINAPGIPHYVRVTFDPSSDPSWVKYEVSSYPIFFCRKPRALIRGKRE